MSHVSAQIPVTVGVTTYNSAKSLAETLDSIYALDYAALHLIVSDDASQDDSLERARTWLAEKEAAARFLTVQVLEVPQNTGVSGNCNRIIAAAPSDWIKFIAGDDILLPHCISANMDYAAKHPAARIIFSQVALYRDNFAEANFVKMIPDRFPDNLMHPDFGPHEQWRLLLEADRMSYTPSYFFHRAALAAVGNYDEANRLQEDYPMWLKLTRAGFRLHYFHQCTVGYRQHSASLNNTGGNPLFNAQEVKTFAIRRKEAHPHLPRLRQRRELWGHAVKSLFLRQGWQKQSSPFKRAVLKMGCVYLNPWFYLEALQRRLVKTKYS